MGVAQEKAKAVVEELRSMKFKEAAKKVEDGIEETLIYCDFQVQRQFIVIRYMVFFGILLRIASRL